MGRVLLEAVVAGLLASLACGLGVLPLLIRRLDPARHRGLGYAVAGGLMFAASVYNLILPGLNMGGGSWSLRSIVPILAGILLGAWFLSATEGRLANWERRRDARAGGSNASSNPVAGLAAAAPFAAWGGRIGLLVFLAMTVHSIPEGVAVGVGYTSDAVGELGANLGPTLALAIAIHNIPEGLAVGIPLRSAGVSLWRCFGAAVFTSLPQPLAAIPAVLLAWFFQPLMPLLMGFAAGAMIFLIVLELIPEALHDERPTRIAWAFTGGFCLMLLVQVVL